MAATHHPANQGDDWNELIDGQLVLLSPRPAVIHNMVAGNIYRIFSNFLLGKGCIPFGDGTALCLTEKNRFVPDGMIVCRRELIREDGVYGVPELVVEVLSPGTARYDRGRKKDIYESAGVREYWIVDPRIQSIEVYLLHGGKFLLDNLYSLYPDYFLESITDAEKEELVTEFHCSLFADLTISLHDVFYTWF